MKEYLFTIVCIAAVDFLIYFLSCTVNNHSFDRYIKIALKLCMLSIIIYPIAPKESFADIYDRIEIEEKYTDEKELSENSLYILERECEERLSEYIFQKAGIKPRSVSIQIEKKENENSVNIKEATIKMPKIAEDKNEELKKIAAEALKWEVEIIYDE